MLLARGVTSDSPKALAAVRRHPDIVAAQFRIRKGEAFATGLELFNTGIVKSLASEHENLPRANIGLTATLG